MQSTKKNKLYRIIGILLKALMLALTFWFIYDRIYATENLDEIINSFNHRISNSSNSWYFITAVLLVFVNWGLEAFKWKYLIYKIEKISFYTAIKAILSGVTVSVFTPNRIGEYAGRVVYIKKADRIKAALITVISSLSQLTITLLVGSLALLFYLDFYHQSFIGSLSIYIAIQLYVVFFVLVLFVFINTPFLTIILSRVKFLWKRFRKYIQVFSYYSQKDLLWVLTLSFIRYMVFSLQYFLLLRFFDVEISIVESLVLIPVYFLTLTAIPTITLAELGVREVVAITVFTAVSTNNIGLISSSFVIWLINLAIPALVGVVFVLQARLFKTK